MSDALSHPASKKGRTQRAVLDLLEEHEAAGDDALPTSSTFIFYELEQRGLATKPNPDDTRRNRRRSIGWPPGRQDIIDAVLVLRETGEVSWWWIVDESRELTLWPHAATILDYLLESLADARLDPWQGQSSPLVLCESRATAGVLRATCGRYGVPIAGLGGQCHGFLMTEVAPLFEDGMRLVLYLGDLDFSGNHIEDNARRVLERATGESLEKVWLRLGMTETLAVRHDITPILKTDGRTKRAHEAIEVESLGQGAVIALVRDALDARLPEPLASVHEREAQQRAEIRRHLARLEGRNP